MLAYDDQQYFVQKNLSIILPKVQKYNLKYILAIMNSRLMDWYFRVNFFDRAVKSMHLKKFPIKILSIYGQEPFIKLVDKIVTLNKHINQMKDKKTDERARVEKEIQKIDKEIDELVYKIYGITEKEKKIIEKSID